LVHNVDTKICLFSRFLYCENYTIKNASAKDIFDCQKRAFVANYKAVSFSQNNTKIAIGVVFFSLLVFGAGFYYGSVKGQAQGSNATTVPPQVQAAAGEADMQEFWKAWKVLDEKFVPRTQGSSTASTTGASTQERVYGAISGMTESFGDPYTIFLPPTENEVFEGNIEGEFGGVGMEIGKRDGVLTVISPLEGTPAKRAGLQPGDKIVAINDETTEDMSVQRAVQLIRGEKGINTYYSIGR
jgi:carboxyl-terminal processing protease